MPDGSVPDTANQDQPPNQPLGPLSHPLLGNRQPEARAPTREQRLAPPVNIRVTIPILGNRFYFALLAGKERRGGERLALERRRNPVFTKNNVVFLLAGAAVLYALTIGAFLALAA